MFDTQVENFRHGNSGHRATDPVSDENFLPAPSARVYASIIEAIHKRKVWMREHEDRTPVMMAECGAFESVALWLLQAYGQDTRMLPRDVQPGAVLKFRNL